MADKPRVRAPKQRTTASTGDPGRRRRLLALGTSVGVGLVAAAMLFVAFGRGESANAQTVRADLEAAGCTLQVANAQPARHTIPPDGRADWNTDPPTTGPHYGFNPDGSLGTVVWGDYPEPVQLARVVHNTEHGGIYIFYGRDVPKTVVDDVRSFYNRHKNGTVLAPLPRLGDKIAMGAWVVEGSDANGYLAKCRAFDDGAFSAFFDTFQFEGPERIPGASLLPGDN